jgi:hypothetical protein
MSFGAVLLFQHHISSESTWMFDKSFVSGQVVFRECLVVPMSVSSTVGSPFGWNGLHSSRTFRPSSASKRSPSRSNDPRGRKRVASVPSARVVRNRLFRRRSNGKTIFGRLPSSVSFISRLAYFSIRSMAGIFRRKPREG